MFLYVRVLLGLLMSCVLHLQTMVDAFDCSHAVLRAAYDISEGNVERWLMMLQDR